MFFKLFVLALCINVGAMVMSNIDHFNPATAIEVEDQPAIANYTVPTNKSYILGNLTYPSNTTSGNLFNWFEESTERIFFAPEVIFKFITGGFIVNIVSNASTSMGFVWPEDFLFGLTAIVGITQVAFWFYIITGRSTSSFTSLYPPILLFTISETINSGIMM